MGRTIHQKRAAFALAFIRSHTGAGYKEKLLTHILKAPTQTLQNGLGQMLAFLLADNEGNWDENDPPAVKGRGIKPSGRLYQQIQTWLCGTNQPEVHPCRVYTSGAPDLIYQLMEGTRQEYVRAERETLAILGWMKKFAEAWLK